MPTVNKLHKQTKELLESCKSACWEYSKEHGSHSNHGQLLFGLLQPDNLPEVDTLIL